MITFISFSLLYIPKDGWNFRIAIENALREAGKSSTLVRDVTEFDWDFVCYVPQYPGPYLYSGSSHPLDDASQRAFKDNLSYLYYLPSFQGAFLFFKDYNLIEEFSFFSPGYRFVSGAWVKPLKSWVIEGREYVFLSENMMEDWPCFRAEDAAFKMEFFEKWDQGKITIGNNKENK